MNQKHPRDFKGDGLQSKAEGARMSEPTEKLPQQNPLSSIANFRSLIASLCVRHKGILNAVIAILLTLCLTRLIFFLSDFPGYAVFRLSLANHTVKVPCNYFILALTSSLLVRLVLRFFREWELRSTAFARMNLPPTISGTRYGKHFGVFIHIKVPTTTGFLSLLVCWSCWHIPISS